MAERLRVRVVSPERIAYEGEASAITAPAWDGRVGILPGHAPFITLLGQGHFIIDLPGGGHEGWWVAGGALKVEGNEVTALTEFAARETPDELPASVTVAEPEDIMEDWSAGNPLA